MARNFANGSTDFVHPVVHVPSAITGTGTVAMRVKLAFAAGSGSNNAFFSLLNGTNNGESIKFYHLNTNTFNLDMNIAGNYQNMGFADTSVFTSGIWQTWMFVWDSAGPVRRVYVDNVQKATNSNVWTSGTANNIYIGNDNASPTWALNGSLADVTLSLVPWGTNERAAYQAGYTGDQIANAFDHWPLWGVSPEPNTFSVDASTVQGTTVVASPPLIFPRRRTFYVVAAAGGGTVTGAGSAAGIGAATATGASTVARAGSSAGVGTAQAAATAIKTTAGTAAGAGVASGTGAATAAGVGNAAGQGLASGVSTATATIAGAGVAVGASSVAGVGVAIVARAGTAAGASAAVGVGAGLTTAAGVASAAGASTALATGAASAAGKGTATGTSAATAAAITVGVGVGLAAGTSSAIGKGTSKTAGIHVRYSVEARKGPAPHVIAQRSRAMAVIGSAQAGNSP